MKASISALTVILIALTGAFGCDDGSSGTSASADADVSSDTAETQGGGTSGMSDADGLGSIDIAQGPIDATAGDAQDGGAPGDAAPNDAKPDDDAPGDASDTSMADQGPAVPDVSDAGDTQVLIVTTLGDFVLEMNAEASPATVANFLGYVEKGFYDGSDGLGATQFHRVIAGFMVQGGGFTAQGIQKETEAPIAHESPNGLSNLRGTVAMARTNELDSATSQFYVNHLDNLFLDYVSPGEPGYVVFGEVVTGMDTIDAIAAVATDGSDQPLSPVLLESVSVLGD